MGRAIDIKTRQDIQNILEDLLKNPGIEKAAAFKNDGTLYASRGFLRKDASEIGRFTVAMARIFENHAIGADVIGINSRKLLMSDGIIIILAGTTTLLAVIVNYDKGHRSMTGNADKKIEQAAGLIAKIMG